uniref:Uncharacterized protein n=1 Tax=Nelumbo nucifera TaxID=4432 RepID=A0A822Z8R3_NELNU|nr:TPA_asm: hypothetical protein HUJ06_015765 [Nelumbo nucifera]
MEFPKIYEKNVLILKDVIDRSPDIGPRQNIMINKMLMIICILLSNKFTSSQSTLLNRCQELAISMKSVHATYNNSGEKENEAWRGNLPLNNLLISFGRVGISTNCCSVTPSIHFYKLNNIFSSISFFL